MAIQELSTASPAGLWRVPQVSTAIEYSLELLEEIRAFACDELLQLSHAGNEVGGVLFGTRRDDLIRIVTWRPIACEHSQGENFAFSSNDRMNLAVQLELARQNADLKDLRPVGCFVSHLHEGVCLRPSDLEIYNGFFPETWQVALVISPKGEGCAEAGFFVREAGEKLRTESSYRSIELRPPPNERGSRPAQAPGKSAPAANLQAGDPLRSPGTLRTGLPSGLRPGPGTGAAAAPAPASPTPAEQQAPAAELPLPSFQTEERITTRERWMWAIPIVLALGIAAFLLYQRSAPAGNNVGLRVSNQDQTVLIHWDASSRAVRDAYRGEIQIDDGGKKAQISLNNEQLHSGKMSYLAQSGDVGFGITVYQANGEPVHDSTRWVSHAATQPPQLLPESAPGGNAAPAPAPVTGSAASPARVIPAPASTSPPTSPALASTPPAAAADRAAADQAALQKQVQDLRAALAKERARADELQNLVRILENRLAIQPSRPAQSH